MGQQAECIAHKSGLATVRGGEKCGEFLGRFSDLKTLRISTALLWAISWFLENEY